MHEMTEAAASPPVAREPAKKHGRVTCNFRLVRWCHLFAIMKTSPPHPAGGASRAVALALGALCALSPSVCAASTWEDVSGGLFNEARHDFASRLPDAPAAERRGLRYGEAAALLNVQPRTQANVDRAFAILDEVWSSGKSDDLGMEARYLMGRIEQIHRQSPDAAKADSIFSSMIAENAAHPVAQRAAVKLAILRLYAPGTPPQERRRRYDEFSRLAASLDEQAAKVQMGLLLGEYARRMGYGEGQELGHLLAAHAAGITKRNSLMTVLARIGDLARLTGRDALAVEYYGLFLREFPRTDRRTTIEGYLATLNAPAK